MPENTSHSFFDQLIEAIEQAQREAQAPQRATQADVERARREMARERMEKEEEERKRAEKEAAEKAAAAKKTPIQVEELEDSKSPLGEEFDARKMVIYSEIMNPKYKE